MTVYLNISDFCKLIGRSREWFYGQLDLGQGPPIRVRRGGHSPCVPLTEAEAWALARAEEMSPKFRARWRAMAARIRAEMAAHATVAAAAAAEREEWIAGLRAKYPPRPRPRGRHQGRRRSERNVQL